MTFESLSPEAKEITLGLQHWLARLDDHRNQEERAVISKFVASHIRSSQPQAMLSLAEEAVP